MLALAVVLLIAPSAKLPVVVFAAARVDADGGATVDTVIVVVNVVAVKAVAAAVAGAVPVVMRPWAAAAFVLLRVRHERMVHARLHALALATALRPRVCRCNGGVGDAVAGGGFEGTCTTDPDKDSVVAATSVCTAVRACTAATLAQSSGGGLLLLV